MGKNSIGFLAWLLVWIGVSVHLSGAGWAQSANTDQEVSFEDAYASYQSAIAESDFAAALPAAQQAYELGRARFGRVNQNVAALAMNYGRMLQIAGANDALASELFSEADTIYEELHDSDSLGRVNALMARASVQSAYEDRLESIRTALRMHRAVLPDDDVAYARQQAIGGELLAGTETGRSEGREMLEDALGVLEKELGDDSPELISTLFALASASATEGTVNRRQLRYFDRALEIASATNTNSPEVIADLEFRTGLQLAEQSRGYGDALTYVRAAHGRFEGLFGSDHPKTALAALTLGEASVATNDNEAGVIHLENAIEYYEGKPEDWRNLVRARRALAALSLVEEDEALFEKQLVAMSRLSTDIMEPLEYLPILKYPPTHPREARNSRANGYVLVEFTVDGQGRVRDPVVVESRSGSGIGTVFHDAAIEAAQKYRYVPRFENGVAVSVPEVRDTITFEFERNAGGPRPAIGAAGETGIGMHEFQQ